MLMLMGKLALKRSKVFSLETTGGVENVQKERIARKSTGRLNGLIRVEHLSIHLLTSTLETFLALWVTSNLYE